MKIENYAKKYKSGETGVLLGERDKFKLNVLKMYAGNQNKVIIKRIFIVWTNVHIKLLIVINACCKCGLY